MKKNLSALALTGTLALGGLLGYSLSTRNAAQTVPAAQATASAPQPQGSTNQGVTSQGTTNQGPISTPTMVPATLEQPTRTYDQGRARTESEANTVQVVKERQDGLVYISVKEASGGSAQAQLRQRLQDQFGLTPPDGEQTGTGSGFFVDAQGDIITNNHVVEGAEEITIRLHGSKQTYKAKVVARAPDYDLALIRAEGLPKDKIRPLPLGDSSQLDVGLKAIAMGAPFDLDFSVSEGIISSVERQVGVGQREVMQNVIQTDAAINPGNSGGPLLNSAGQVIGVNTQILTGGAGQSAGVGFAIPVNTVKQLLPQLQAGKGADAIVSPPSLGIQFTDLSGISAAARKKAGLPNEGALIQHVYPGSPAAAAGLKAGTNEDLTLQAPDGSSQQISTDGDIVTAINGQAVKTGSDLQQAVFGSQAGQKLKLTVERSGKKRDVDVTLRAFALPQN